MQEVGKILREFFRDIRAAKEEGDVYGEDGLLVCGKCGHPKESRIDHWAATGKEIEPRYSIKPVPCECKMREIRKAEQAREERERAREMDRNRARCFDIEGMAGCRFEDDDGQNGEQSAVCRRFVKNFEAAKEKDQGLLMWGDAGTGKTFLAGCIANALLEQGYKVKATSLAFLNGRITANYGNAQPVIEELKAHDLVIFDDLGTERKTTTANENAFQIVDALEKKGVPMVFTTNIYAREMAEEQERNNVRIYSRIMGKCKPLKFEGVDRRKASAGEDWAF